MKEERMNPDLLIDAREVKKILGIGHTTLYQWMSEGKFPTPLQLSPQCVRWRLSEVNAWIDSRPRKDARMQPEQPPNHNPNVR